MRARSVRTRLTLWSVGVLALSLLVFGGTLRYIVQANLMTAIDRSLLHQARAEQARTAQVFGSGSDPRFDRDGGGPPPGDFTPGQGPPPQNPAMGPGRPPGQGGHIAQEAPPAPPTFHRVPQRPPNPGGADYVPASLLDLRERPLIPGRASIPSDPDNFPKAVRGAEVYDTVQIGPRSLRVFSAPLRASGKIIGVVQEAAPLAEANREMLHLTRALLALVPLVLLIAGAGGAFLTGRTLRPVRAITLAANRISAESLSGRLTIVGEDEFSQLAATFNEMLARLEGAFQKLTVAYEQEQRFTADASHELRTPLTVIKAHTSLCLDGDQTIEDYRESMEAIDEAVDRTNRLVESLLLLAKSDAGRLPLHLRSVSLQSVTDQAAQVARPANGPDVHLRIPDTLPPIEGDADVLLQLFTNLLTNAVRHTPQNGSVVITGEQCESTVVVTVRDTGEGIPPEHLPHLFERFYRVESSRTSGQGGNGLGLAICRDIVRAHHGSLKLDSVVGEGTQVCVTLPQVQPATVSSPSDTP